MKRLLVVMVKLTSSTFISALAAFAQNTTPLTIRVETNRVLVPTYVWDKDKMDQHFTYLKDWPCGARNIKTFLALKPSESYLPLDCDLRRIPGLTAKDFHVFDDGAEQKIASVTLEPLHWIPARDNIGMHIEFSGTPKGKWSSLDLHPVIGIVPFGGRHIYLITYAPPPSAQGTCHHIKVSVDRRNTFVYSRHDYCNTLRSPSDPLSGTKLGEQLERGVISDTSAKIPIFMQAGFFQSGLGTSRVEIAMEVPWNSLRREWSESLHSATLHATVGIMGMAYRKTGELAARFSDLGCCSSDEPEEVRTRWEEPDTARPDKEVVEIPNRYETQMDLAPGDYRLVVALGDGSKFGRLEVPLTVEPYDGKQLALSSIILCKRFRDANAAEQEAVAANLAPQYVPLVSNGTQFTPAGDTRFQKGEPMFAYFEVYEPLLTATQPASVQIRMKITDANTGEIKVDTGLRDASPWIQRGRSTISVADKIAV